VLVKESPKTYDGILFIAGVTWWKTEGYEEDSFVELEA
jgi:hypothetical protein